MTQAVDVFDERVLVLTPTGSDGADAHELLTRAGLCCRVCNDLVDVCTEISRGAAAVIVAEEALSWSEIPAFANFLDDQPRWSDLQVFLLTSHTQLRPVSTGLIERLGRSMTVTLLERPFRTHTLLSMLALALRSRRRQYEVRDLLEELGRSNAELEQRVSERTAQLKSSIESLEAFGHSLAHDLRAPLRTIRSYMNVLEHDYRTALNGEGTEILARVSTAAARMDALINDLLTLARISKEEVPLLPVSAGRVLADALMTLDGEVKRTGAQVEVEPMQQMVRGNPVLLRQVLENFLTNAMKYTKKGEPPHLRILEQRSAELVRVMVKDYGIGIAPEHRQRIFDAFTRLHTNGYAGTGIGLAIAKAAAQRMGGTVGVSSDDSPGVCFWVELAATN
jgi:signal transduction histidine kinase